MEAASGILGSFCIKNCYKKPFFSCRKRPNIFIVLHNLSFGIISKVIHLQKAYHFTTVRKKDDPGIYVEDRVGSSGDRRMFSHRRIQQFTKLISIGPLHMLFQQIPCYSTSKLHVSLRHGRSSDRYATADPPKLHAEAM